jgi:hypothetical protein
MAELSNFEKLKQAKRGVRVPISAGEEKIAFLVRKPSQGYLAEITAAAGLVADDGGEVAASAKVSALPVLLSAMLRDLVHDEGEGGRFGQPSFPDAEAVQAAMRDGDLSPLHDVLLGFVQQKELSTAGEGSGQTQGSGS